MKQYKFKKWWWNWLKPKDWYIDLMILELAERNKAKNERFIEQQKKQILEKYYKRNIKLLKLKKKK